MEEDFRRSKPRAQWKCADSITGILLILLGVILLGVVVAYYSYRAYSHSHLDELIYTPSEIIVTPEVTQTIDATPNNIIIQKSSPHSYSGNSSHSYPEYSSQSDPLDANTFLSIFPGSQLNPKYWVSPIWAGTESIIADELPNGFAPISAEYRDTKTGILSAATHISIPSINVNSTVHELTIRNLGDSRTYETPKNTVGHIPGTANPGQVANGWYFGHLESPIKGEGNVFSKLPQIPDLLRLGEKVYIALESDNGIYLYQAISTNVLLQSELELYSSNEPIITLVACVPRLVYDHRLLVSAQLVGIKPGNSRTKPES